MHENVEQCFAGRASTDVVRTVSCEDAMPREKRGGGVAFTYFVTRAPAGHAAAEGKIVGTRGTVCCGHTLDTLAFSEARA